MRRDRKDGFKKRFQCSFPPPSRFSHRFYFYNRRLYAAHHRLPPISTIFLSIIGPFCFTKLFFRFPTFSIIESSCNIIYLRRSLISTHLISSHLVDPRIQASSALPFVGHFRLYSSHVYDDFCGSNGAAISVNAGRGGAAISGVDGGVFPSTGATATSPSSSSAAAAGRCGIGSDFGDECIHRNAAIGSSSSHNRKGQMGRRFKGGKCARFSPSI